METKKVLVKTNLTSKEAEDLFNKGQRVRHESWEWNVFLDKSIPYAAQNHIWDTYHKQNPTGWMMWFDDSVEKELPLPMMKGKGSFSVIPETWMDAPKDLCDTPDLPVYYTKGMKVGHHAFGNGVVDRVDSEFHPGYPVIVNFSCGIETFTFDGKKHKDDIYPSLFQHEINTLTLKPADTRIELPEDVTIFLSKCEVIRGIVAHEELKKKYKI